VRVHVGPLPSEGVTEWIVFARRMLDDGPTGRRPLSETTSDEVLVEFRRFLDEWDAAARSSDTFVWETEIDPEQAEFLAHALFNIATEVFTAANRRGTFETPPAGAPFYRAFIEAFLHAMTMENKSLAAYAEELRTSWPGVQFD
jgi:hypothetical protein